MTFREQLNHIHMYALPCVHWLNVVDLARIKLHHYLMLSIIMNITLLLGVSRASFPFSYLVNIIVATVSF